jgi:predicted N-acetyltransferase YhbS
MRFEKYKSVYCDEIRKLFTDVFANSEGQDEGKLIGDLAFELQRTTPEDDFLGFVALAEEKIAGCIFLTRLRFQSEINAFILSPVAVATKYQGEGVGQKLINFGFEQLKEGGGALAFTYGDINFYSKVGFKQITEDVAKAPLKLTYPEGWLAQSLIGKDIQPIPGSSICVEALNDQKYW